MGKFGDLLMQQAGGAAGNAAQGIMGGLTGMLFAGYNDRRQMKQQTKLQNLQIAGDKELTDYNFNKELQMWKDTGYGPQMQQLKEAGLNPALIYGTGGSGGMTTDIKPGQVNGADAPKGGGEVMGMAIASMQMQLMNAQRKNIEADTQNKEAQTGAIPTQIEKTKSETQLNIANTGNTQADTELKQIQSSILSIEEHVKGQTQNAQIATIMTGLLTATKQLEGLQSQNKITAAQAKNIDQRIRLELANTAMNTWLQSQEGKLANQQEKESVNRVIMQVQNNMREWDKMAQTNTQIQQAQQKLDYETEVPNSLKEILDRIFIIPKFSH